MDHAAARKSWLCMNGMFAGDPETNRHGTEEKLLRKGGLLLGTSRINSLDGLRGIACVVVMLLHVGAAFHPLGDDFNYGLIPGTSSVLVFFILSGIVLSLGPLKKESSGEGYGWFAYYPRRIARLYIPMLAAIAFGLVASLTAKLLGSTTSSAGAIDIEHGFAQALHDVLMQFDVFFNVGDDTYNLYGMRLLRVEPTIWSMSWELWFSMCLPFVIWCVLRIKKSSVALSAIAIAIFISAYTGYFPRRFCLLFVVGSLIALNFVRVSGLCLKSPAELLLLAAAIVGMELPQIVTAPAASEALAQTARHLAAMLIVVLAIAQGSVKRVLSHGICCKLGTISYSLYLTHTILLGGLKYALPKLGITGPWIQSAVTVAVSLAAAVVFWHFVERPSIKLSHEIGH